MVAMARSDSHDTSKGKPDRDNAREGFDVVESETIAIIGADCMTGRQATEVALGCGYQVQALIHDRLALSHKQLRVLQGNPYDARHLRTVIHGSSCVINLLNLHRFALPKDLCDEEHSRATITKNVLAAMQREQIRRYILVTHPSVVMPGDRRINVQGFASKYLWPVLHRQRWKDLQSEADLLSRSNVAWTLARCPCVKNVAGFAPIDIDRRCPIGRSISLDRLASFLIHQKDCENYLGEAIFIGNRSRQSFRL